MTTIIAVERNGVTIGCDSKAVGGEDVRFDDVPEGCVCGWEEVTAMSDPEPMASLTVPSEECLLHEDLYREWLRLVKEVRLANLA